MSSPYAWLALYSGLILAVSLFGGWVPLIGRVTHSRLQMYLSLSAGVMLGAAFFHVMPEALKDVSLAFLFCRIENLCFCCHSLRTLTDYYICYSRCRPRFNMNVDSFGEKEFIHSHLQHSFSVLRGIF